MKTLILHNTGMDTENWTTSLWLNDQGIKGYGGVVDILDEYVEHGRLKSGYRLERHDSHGSVELTSYEEEVVGGQVFDGAKTVHAVLKPRQITINEQKVMTLPELPDARWLRECYRLGMNPLPTCRHAFPGWHWEYMAGIGEGEGFNVSLDGRTVEFPTVEIGKGGGRVFATR